MATMQSIEIEPFTHDAGTALEAHLQRHRLESGNSDIHFMPFAPGSSHGPRGINLESALLPLDTPGWQRWFCAREIGSGNIVGHVNLKSDSLETGLHRCELGIGIERAFRGQGLGKRLMNHAIAFARNSEHLTWIELKVFAHNSAARALYRQLGFEEVGMVPDRFRILGESIDDAIMILNVATPEAHR
ncbi:MAG TPA: N-acetyltransferase [Hyphomicrobiales bacterium]|nr:N-acetyltransferase [Hyphomicrobiales bacterium]